MLLAHVSALCCPASKCYFNEFWEYTRGLLPGTFWSEAVPGESYPNGQLNQMDLRSTKRDRSVIVYPIHEMTVSRY